MASANDGDLSTAWQSPANPQGGTWVNFEYPKAISVDELEFSYLNDGRHSTPKSIHLEGDGVASASIEVPEAKPGDTRGDTTTVRLEVPEAVPTFAWSSTRSTLAPRWSGSATSEATC